MTDRYQAAIAAPATPAAPPTRPGVGLRIEQVSAYYGSHQAVGDVTMTVEPNRVTALIGPSGCGKSTLIRCLNRLHEITRGARATGKVLLQGQDIYGPRVDPVQVRRLIGMVFQKPNPFPMMSLYDNVVAGIKLNSQRLPKARLDEIVERSLRGAALWDEVKDKLHASGAALSGGQAQRLCIARTIAVEPEIILMDEPCSALDPISTLRIEELILRLKAHYTIVIVTHNMQQAARVSDVTGFMLAGEDRVGRLVEFGRTPDLFTRPTDKRTEAYITGRFG
ncbi:MAG: phosphate ABC transporter ATP-binding protein [Chloroflexi bacterium]|nr:phosphate ABC transporter ATP-binding protein [Chloroflexota bacterium]